jgi:hypothetical protein
MIVQGWLQLDDYTAGSAMAHHLRAKFLFISLPERWMLFKFAFIRPSTEPWDAA